MSFTLNLPDDLIREIHAYRGVSVNRDNFNIVMYQLKKYIVDVWAETPVPDYMKIRLFKYLVLHDITGRPITIS